MDKDTNNADGNVAEPAEVPLPLLELSDGLLERILGSCSVADKSQVIQAPVLNSFCSCASFILLGCSARRGALVAASQNLQLVCLRFRSVLRHPTAPTTWRDVKFKALNIDVAHTSHLKFLDALVRWLIDRRRGGAGERVDGALRAGAFFD